MNMWELKPQQSAEVAGIDIQEKNIEQRLNDLGICAGQSVQCLQWIPFGGPRSYKLSSGIFAIDKEVAQSVKLTISGWEA